ncbi:MAG: hypothetical protein HZC28_06525 [Spirochaetes bacterium]|nr:hypothetical protein [Spirochaetota bacterium]
MLRLRRKPNPATPFVPYVRRYGARFMKLVDAVRYQYITAMPGMIVRYARILS